jgi:hypothetical protein
MPSLRHLQQEMTRAVLGGETDGIASLLLAGRGEARDRFEVYRNNCRLSLTQALIDNFPVTVRLVDERFFRFAADGFIRRHPPRDPRLALYGRELALYLARMPELAGHPEVAATARLEWLILEALAAPAPPPAPFGDLARLGVVGAGARLHLQPSLRLGTSRHPVLDIWRTHQDGKVPDALPSGGGRCFHLVWRSPAGLRLGRLDRASFAFLHALLRGLEIERAAARALQRDRMFDLAPHILSLFDAGLIAAVEPAPAPQRCQGDVP